MSHTSGVRALWVPRKVTRGIWFCSASAGNADPVQKTVIFSLTFQTKEKRGRNGNSCLKIVPLSCGWAGITVPPGFTYTDRRIWVNSETWNQQELHKYQEPTLFMSSVYLGPKVCIRRLGSNYSFAGNFLSRSGQVTVWGKRRIMAQLSSYGWLVTAWERTSWCESVTGCCMRACTLVHVHACVWMHACACATHTHENRSWLSWHVEGSHAASVCLLTLPFSPQVTPVPELFLTAVKLSHDNTGARYLHLAREDKNNLFRCVLLWRACSWMSLSNTCAICPEMLGNSVPFWA